VTPVHRWLLATLLAAAVVCVLALNRGWEPVGEGAIAQSAERVLQGEVPHRDFDEIYTGALTYVHAAAFAIGGIRLSVLRIPLLLVALAWVAVFFSLAQRMVPPAGAALLTLLALSWSVPNDPSPMPSWYNLFLATFAIYALTRWIETLGRGWLVLAGACGGASLLMKLSGVFLLMGAGLFLLEASRSQEGDESSGARHGPAVRSAITLGLALIVVALWRSVAPRGYLNIVHFVLPVALLALGLAVREWTSAAVSGRARLGALARAAAPFAGGAALVIAPFALYLAAVGGLDDTIRGVFVTSFRRVDQAGMQPPRLFWLAAAVPLLLLLRPRSNHAAWWGLRSLVVAGGLAGVLVLGSVTFFPQQVVWQSLRSLGPTLGVVTGVVLAVGPARLGWPEPKHRLVVLFGIIAVLHTLIQFPFAGPNYFYYVAPLVFLAAGGFVAGGGRTPVGLQLAVAGFYLAFAVLEVMPGSQAGLALHPQRRPDPVAVALPRVGLLVAPRLARLYDSLLPLVRERAADGRIWAGPEAPQIYFLGGFRNRTRELYAFLGSASPESGLAERHAREEASVIVINQRPVFSPPLSKEAFDSLAKEFPASTSIDRFMVRWR
jgi:hypothetical protein